MVSIRPVDDKNLEQVLKLKTAPSQEGFIESTEECLMEAKALPLWNPVAIYLDEQVAGFAMYGFWKDEGTDGRMWLDRFLIDEGFQGQGIGKEAIGKLIFLLMNEQGHDKIYLSLYSENKAAEALYQKAGFRYNGE